MNEMLRPVMGQRDVIVQDLTPLCAIGLVGSPSVLGEPTSALQYGLSWAVAARASDGVLPYNKYFVPSGGAIPHQTPDRKHLNDLPYFNYLDNFLNSYGGYGAPDYGYPFGNS